LLKLAPPFPLSSVLLKIISPEVRPRRPLLKPHSGHPKYFFMESKKIDILLQENENFRAEIIAMIKNIHNCLFSFIGSLGLFVGILLNLNKKDFTYNHNAGILAFLISQVGIIIILLAINIQADVFTKAAYINHIENKINNLVGETLIFWEGKIACNKPLRSVMGISQFCLFLSYFISFVFLTLYSYENLLNLFLLFIQIGEGILLAVLSFKLTREFYKVKRYIHSLEQMQAPMKDLI